MSTLEEDKLYSSRVLFGGHMDYYNHVYYKSNENLYFLFSQIDIAGKDVLTVVGSGDQSFHCYDRDAKSVTLFDKNKLTIYYYYLRLWVIKYLNKYYPDDCFPKDWMYFLLGQVECRNQDEKDALMYWKYIISTYGEDTYNRLFFRGFDDKNNELENLSKLKNRINKDNVNFYLTDISKDNNIEGMYDLIITSNIGDYIIQSEEVMKSYRNITYKLLKKDGMIVNSNLRKCGPTNLERNTFEEMFDYKELNEYSDFPVGYVYKKGSLVI